MSSSEHEPGTEFQECPACGGKIWDNREKIESGQFKGKAPHFVCADKVNCKWASWPAKDKKGSSGAPGATTAPRPRPTHSARTVSGPLTGGYSWDDQSALGLACLQRARDQMAAVVGGKLEQRAIVAWAATGMIGAKQDHLMPPESLSDMPKALEDQGDEWEAGRE